MLDNWPKIIFVSFNKKLRINSNKSFTLKSQYPSKKSPHIIIRSLSSTIQNSKIQSPGLFYTVATYIDTVTAPHQPIPWRWHDIKSSEFFSSFLPTNTENVLIKRCLNLQPRLLDLHSELYWGNPFQLHILINHYPIKGM